MANEHEGYLRPLRWPPEEPATSGPWVQLSIIVPASVKYELAQLAKAEKRTLSRQCWALLSRGLVREQSKERDAYG
jgi:hypothetical protein